MKTTLIAIALSTLAMQAWAQGATCAAQAEEKKLAGAAKTSFLKKCQKDTQASCETAAAEKKLAGAAKNSYVKKCASDAAGASAAKSS